MRRPASVGRIGIIADLGVTVRMREDAGAEMARHHLRAEADAEIGLLVAQRHADPVDLALHELLVVVGALRAAENHRAGVAVHRFRQRIAEARPADVERIAEFGQHLADPAGRGMFLVQDEEDRLHGVAATRDLAASRGFANRNGENRLCLRRGSARLPPVDGGQQ